MVNETTKGQVSSKLMLNFFIITTTIFMLSYHYTLNLSLDNHFTKDGLTIFNENVFKLFKELDNESLLKLRDIFIEKDTKFIIDVYKKKDFDRNYKIFYKNECIEIKEEESKLYLAGNEIKYLTADNF